VAVGREPDDALSGGALADDQRCANSLEKPVFGTDPQQAMSGAAKAIQPEIEKYTATVKK